MDPLVRGFEVASANLRRNPPIFFDREDMWDSQRGLAHVARHAPCVSSGLSLAGPLRHFADQHP